MKSLFTVYITCSLFYLILLIYRIKKKKKLATIASQSSQSPFLVYYLVFHASSIFSNSLTFEKVSRWKI